MNIYLKLFPQISILLGKLFLKSGNSKIVQKINKVMNKLIMKIMKMKKMMKFIRIIQIQQAETNFMII